MLALIFNFAAELFGIEILNAPDFAELVMRFAFNFIVTLVIVRYIYYPRTHHRDFLFTFDDALGHLFVQFFCHEKFSLI